MVALMSVSLSMVTGDTVGFAFSVALLSRMKPIIATEVTLACLPQTLETLDDHTISGVIQTLLVENDGRRVIIVQQSGDIGINIDADV